jgi:ubiquinone/menaquinone biosynthesis C-methylase UbiE
VILLLVCTSKDDRDGPRIASDKALQLTDPLARGRVLVRAIPKKLVAKDCRDAYDMWATHFSDPALMANRDAQTTHRKLARLTELLPLGPKSRVLDVGPGDGTLFRLIAERVAECRGVDPSPNAIEKLRRLFHDLSNVEFTLGTSQQIPFLDDSFDVVVVNSVLHALPSIRDVEQSLVELVRVCAPGGVVFVGEFPFRSELERGIFVHMARKLRESGFRNYLRLLLTIYARPILRGEPVVLYPTRNLHMTETDFRSMCQPLGATVETQRHRELAGPSTTRNAYLLTLACAGTAAV